MLLLSMFAQREVETHRHLHITAVACLMLATILMNAAHVATLMTQRAVHVC